VQCAFFSAVQNDKSVRMEFAELCFWVSFCGFFIGSDAQDKHCEEAAAMFTVYDRLNIILFKQHNFNVLNSYLPLLIKTWPNFGACVLSTWYKRLRW